MRTYETGKAKRSIRSGGIARAILKAIKAVKAAHAG
jgi:hypothetical protein